jgi:hypothetical protein
MMFLAISHGLFRWSLAVFVCLALLNCRAAGDTELTGKVVVGYQGWFAPQGDGSNLGWFHYGVNHQRFEPGYCTFDLWPDLSGFDADELYSTPFHFADGSVAPVFSSANSKTVNRHFAWMKEYGIDVAALQRFGVDLRSDTTKAWRDKVLANCRQAAAANDRLWFVMYDLSGLKDQDLSDIIISDWKRLVDQSDFRKDKTYTTYKGRPLVALWGIGFNDGRGYTPKGCAKLIEFFKHDPKYGGNAVMGGVPYFWREKEGDRMDGLPKEEIYPVYQQLDVLSPWAVTRYGNIEEAKGFISRRVKDDKAWCDQYKIGYLPVFFPGFSWYNLEKARGREAKLNFIPRQGGKFLWAQAVAAAKAGAGMGYVAMFDEIDEGTAIFKVTNNPPVGESKFATYEGLPSDHYLWLTGQIGQLMRHPENATESLPKR